MGLVACVAGEGEEGIWAREAREVSLPNFLPLSTACHAGYWVWPMLLTKIWDNNGFRVQAVFLCDKNHRNRDRAKKKKKNSLLPRVNIVEDVE